MTRSEHLQWAKNRALAYLPHNPTEALTSFLSDMRKHEETADHPMLPMTATMALSGLLSDVGKHIQDYN